MTRRASDYDESDVRIRPSRRGSRPRSKDRPAHDDAVPGFVMAVDRGRYTVLVAQGVGGRDAGAKGVGASGVEGKGSGGKGVGGKGSGGKGVGGKGLPERTVMAMKARELGRKGIVVGDDVELVGDTTGNPDGLARIVRLTPRRSVLRRTADDTDPVERVIVANADQLVIVSALANPEPRPRLIDRCLVAAYDARLEPLLVLTKADLADPGPFLANYAPLDVRHIVTATGESGFDGLESLHELLTDRVSVFVGHSGVGKSTLVNGLVPDAKRAIGVVNTVTGRGRHTSSSAVALRLPGDTGWVIDTPGVRSFGLAHVDLNRVIDNFPDLERGTAGCPRGCTHDEEECALDAWVTSGQAGPAGASRLESLRRLLRARSGESD